MSYGGSSWSGQFLVLTQILGLVNMGINSRADLESRSDLSES